MIKPPRARRQRTEGKNELNKERRERGGSVRNSVRDTTVKQEKTREIEEETRPHTRQKGLSRLAR